MKMKFGQKGQTATEYILLLAVIVAIMVPLFQKLDTLILSGNRSFVKTYLGGFESAFFEGNYRTFTIRK